MESTRKIPFNHDSERFILGSILLDNRVASEVISKLDDHDFYVEAHQHIMKAIIHLFNEKKTVDISTISEELKRNKVFEVIGGIDFLLDLLEGVPSVVQTETHIEVVKERSIERELYQTLKEVSNVVVDGKTQFKDLLEMTEKKINNVLNKRQTSEFLKVDTATSRVFDIIEANKAKEAEGIIGINTGFQKLNELTFGFQKGELIILAARPAVGKSALALNFASNACRLSNASVAFFSLEMGMDQLVMRLLSSHSNIDLSKIRSGNINKQEMVQLLGAKQKIDRYQLYLDESSTTELGEIAAQCRKLKRNSKLDLIIIDYLQLVSIRGRSGNRTEEVGQISRGLKILARELNVPIIALSQLSREAERTSEGSEIPRPRLSHLRESGSIEQDADIVMFLHRPSKKGEDGAKRYKSLKIELNIEKNRQGMTDSIPLVFKGAYSQFSPAEDTKE